MERKMSQVTFNKHLQKLQSKQFLNKHDVAALLRAVNKGCSDAQAEQLVFEATNLPTENGLLLELASVHCLIRGPIYVPVYEQKSKLA